MVEARKCLKLADDVVKHGMKEDEQEDDFLARAQALYKQAQALYKQGVRVTTAMAQELIVVKCIYFGAVGDLVIYVYSSGDF
jgi:hypothetical protein